MNRTQKLKKNTTASLIAQITTIISGLILPRLILSNYGAETHGLVNSINQFLGVITFLDLGVGSVVKSVLYHPLSRNDNNKISSIIIAAKNYFENIAFVLIAYVVGLILFYPLFIDSTYSYLSTGFLILSMSISQFGRYYFGIVNELLLSANQQDYIQLGSEIVVVILNLMISITLINLGASIQIVQLGSGLIYLLRPVFLSYYVNINFEIDYGIEIKENPLPQRWNGVGQHIAFSIQKNLDIVILTVFSTLESISIYSIYNMVTSAIKLLISSITTSIQSFFGDLYANDKVNLLNSYFDKIEWGVHTVVIYLYGMTAVLINSFVMLYTTGVEDISYDTPIFSLLLVLASIAYSLRAPYQSMIFSAGHFKETQKSSFIEAALNLILSVLLVNRFSLAGVAVGTLVSMTYRTLYLVVYLSNNIIFRPVKRFLKHILVDFISLGTILFVGSLISNMIFINSFVDWVIVAIILGVLNSFLLFVINIVFYKNIMVSVKKRLLKKK